MKSFYCSILGWGLREIYNSDIFEFESILTAENPLIQTSEKGYLHKYIYIENG